MRRLSVLAALVAVIGLAAPVNAEPTGADADFVAMLDKAGITYRTPEAAIAAAKEVCALMGKGQSGADVVKTMTELNPGFAETSAAQFAAIAATSYCPQYVTGSGSAGDK